MLLLLAAQKTAIEKVASFGASGVALAVSGDGRRIAAGSGDDVAIFGVPEMKVLRTIKGAGTGIDFAGGTLLAGTRGLEGFRILFLDPETGKVLRTLERPEPLAAHEFRGVVATAGYKSFRVHGLAKLESRAFWSRKDIDPRVEVFPFARDGTLAAAVRPGRVSDLEDSHHLVLWKPPYTGKPRLLPLMKRIPWATLSPRADHVAIPVEGTCRGLVFDTATGKQLHELTANEGKGRIGGLTYSPNGRYLLAVSNLAIHGVSEAIVWEVPSYREIGRAEIHQGEGHNARWMPDGSGFVTLGGTPGRATLWRLRRD